MPIQTYKVVTIIISVQTYEVFTFIKQVKTTKCSTLLHKTELQKPSLHRTYFQSVPHYKTDRPTRCSPLLHRIDEQSINYYFTIHQSINYYYTIHQSIHHYYQRQANKLFTIISQDRFKKITIMTENWPTQSSPLLHRTDLQNCHQNTTQFNKVVTIINKESQQSIYHN